MASDSCPTLSRPKPTAVVTAAARVTAASERMKKVTAGVISSHSATIDRISAAIAVRDCVRYSITKPKAATAINMRLPARPPLPR